MLETQRLEEHILQQEVWLEEEPILRVEQRLEEVIMLMDEARHQIHIVMV